MGKSVTLSDMAEQIASARYYQEGEDWNGVAHRVAKALSSVEKDEKWESIFQETIAEMLFIPAGRILRNAGRPKGSLFNCYHLPVGDSIEEIGQFMKDSLTLWSEGGGVGVNFSTLRPKGDPILGKGGASSGLVSFLEASDGLASTIESGGQRRAAGMASVDVSHPEVLDFIDSKLKHNKLSHYNISVSVNDEFLETVERDGDWEFKFNHRSFGKIKAKVIWDKIVENMVNCAEPGLFNWSKMSKNNSYYYNPVTGTNPCGEAVLEPYGVCDLGSIVLPNFISGPSGSTNWKKLSEVIKIGVRMLDNVIDVNKYTLLPIDINAHNGRRIGLGIMGLAEYLFAKQVRYGSPQAIQETEKLMKFIRDHAYLASVELAKEKGAFPKFDPIQYGKASFVRKLPAAIRLDIKEFGIRNVTILSLAPTGTLSLVAGVTSGIEPLFSKAYKRSDRISERVYIHDKYIEYLKLSEGLPEWYVDSYDLKPEDHFEMQAIVQKYADGAVSKTLNMPKGTTKEDLSRLLLEYIHDLKGMTVYVDGSRGEQVLQAMTYNEVTEYFASQEEYNKSLDEESVKCHNGKCEI